MDNGYRMALVSATWRRLMDSARDPIGRWRADDGAVPAPTLHLRRQETCLQVRDSFVFRDCVPDGSFRSGSSEERPACHFVVRSCVLAPSKTGTVAPHPERHEVGNVHRSVTCRHLAILFPLGRQRGRGANGA